MPNANVEGSGPHFEVSVHHAEDEAANDGQRDRPAQPNHPVRQPQLAPSLMQVPSHYHSWNKRKALYSLNINTRVKIFLFVEYILS